MTTSRVPFRESLAGIEVDNGEPPAGEHEEARLANVMELLRLADEYASADGQPTGVGFRAWLATTLRGEDASGGRDAVDVVTFHAAKGLEWPVVYVAGLEDGLVPIGHARTPGEARRGAAPALRGVTRAQDELSFSWAAHRARSAPGPAPRSPSPYLSDVEPASLAAMKAE